MFSDFLSERIPVENNYFENLEDLSTNHKNLTKKSDITKDLSLLSLMPKLSKENNQSLIYCKYFLNGNRCPFLFCKHYHGYSNNLKNDVRIPYLHNENVFKIIKITEEKFLTASYKSIRIFAFKEKFQCLLKINITDELNDQIILQNIFYFSNLIFCCEFNNFNKVMSLIIRYEDKNGEIKKIICESNNREINDLIYLQNDNLILAFGDIYLEMYYLNPNLKQANRIQKIQVDQGKGFCSVVFFNKEFYCGLKNGVLGVLTPNKTGNQIFTTKFERKIHQNEITKLIIIELDAKTHFFLSASLDQSIKMFNYENNFKEMVSKNMNIPVNNLFVSKDLDKKYKIMVCLVNGLIKVLDEMFNEEFDIKGVMSENCIRCGINIIIEDKKKDEDVIMSNDNNKLVKIPHIILNFKNGIEINTWIKG